MVIGPADPSIFKTVLNGSIAGRPTQLSSDFAGFLGLRGLALTGFRAVAGLMLSGLPAATGVTAGSDSGPDLK